MTRSSFQLCVSAAGRWSRTRVSAGLTTGTLKQTAGTVFGSRGRFGDSKPPSETRAWSTPFKAALTKPARLGSQKKTGRPHVTEYEARREVARLCRKYKYDTLTKALADALVRVFLSLEEGGDTHGNY